MEFISNWAATLRLSIEVLALVAFTLSGLLAAAAKRLDAVGVYAVALLTAFGGGTLRDLLLDRRPFFWIGHAEYLWVVLLLSSAAMLWMRQRHIAPTERAIQVPDALGLGLFSAAGVDIALGTGAPALVAVLMGVITGIFGGVLRDIVCNEIPTVFRDHRPYALCAFAGGWLYLGLRELPAPEWLPLTTTAICIAGLRLLALWRNWRLPGWRISD